jgi:hypothetical protein
VDIGIGGILDRKTMHDVVRGHNGVLSLPGNVRMSYSQLRHLARRHGVVHATYRRADVSEMIQDMIRSETKEAAQVARRLGVKLPGRAKLAAKGEMLGPAQISAPITWRQAQRAGEEIGMTIENSDRLQLFIKSLQRGMSPEQAARRVKSFLFDYDDISNFEKNYIRRLFIPFWTWTRKNIALQAKIATKMPGRFVPPAKIARALSDEDDDAIRSDVERELLPRYYEDTFGIRLEAGQQLSKWFMNIDLPAGDLNRLWQGGLRKTTNDWFAMVGPFFREFMQETVNYDFFRGASREQELIRGTRVYDMVNRVAGTKLGKFLKVRRRPYREQTNIYVDSKRWRALMYATLFQFTRAYTTVGRLTDPKQGSLSYRLFNSLTGMRVENVRPAEEIRRMADAAVFDKDTSALAQLRAKFRDATDAIILNGEAAQEGDTLLTQTREAVRTPTSGAELPPEDTLEWIEGE